jgi:hypothetical protein
MNIFRKERRDEIIFSLKRFNTLRYDAKDVLRKLPDTMDNDNSPQFIEGLHKRIACYESYIFNIGQISSPDIRDIVLNSGNIAKRAQGLCVELLEKLNNKETQEVDLMSIQSRANMKGLRITHDMVEEVMEKYHIKPEEIDYRGRI